LESVRDVEDTVLASLLATLVIGVLVSVWLTLAISRPVARLVEATERLREGELGYTVEVGNDRDFSVLVRHFNAMSRALREGQEELRRSQEALRASNERYELAGAGADNGLWDWNLESNRIQFSARWQQMLGAPAEEAEGDLDGLLRRVHPEDVDGLKRELFAHLRGDTPKFLFEYRMAHDDGSWRWMKSCGLAVRDEAGRAYRMAGSQSDVTKRKTYEHQLLHRAHHDSLTGLPNRLRLRERLREAGARARRDEDYLFALLVVDLDRFKVLNDTIGHQLGDQLLVAVVERLKEALRAEDIIGRIGGDDFAVLLDGLESQDAALQTAERLRDALRAPFAIGDHELATTASIGIVLSSTGFDAADDLLHYAETAMSRAQAGGEGRIVVFDRGTDAVTIGRMQLEAELRNVVARGQLRLHYQPILALANDRIEGLEALVRWHHPERGLLAPDTFLPLAEKTGLIVDIGSWVLREAFVQMRSLQRRFADDAPAFISVNLSSRQLAEPGLLDEIRILLDEVGLDPHCVRLEITETALVENTEAAAVMLGELRMLGVRVCLDDFGTGYSSLGYLDRFPISTLKIDRSFIRQMKNEGKTPEIIRAIVGLAKKLHMDVVAEGVESQQQLAQTRDLRCEYVQGYLISKPLTIDGIADLIVARGENREGRESWESR
jgi:diguanylate cyclase (GGDEF)-like protein/PAS domain S-box-containing protein